ncbi:hypothetical protein AX15_003107 [Amanita polypyramis BW_CC]|nr:hypothetical protein AX15_003107 [Amanita polypyramis BW_CC]
MLVELHLGSQFIMPMSSENTGMTLREKNRDGTCCAIRRSGSSGHEKRLSNIPVSMGSAASSVNKHRLAPVAPPTPVVALAATDARKPFNADAFADIIFQSSDNVRFYVHSAFLSFVSPSFRDMFSMNRHLTVDGSEKKDGFPIISVTEDSETLYYLLELIYPVDESQFHDLTVFRKVCKAAQKYLMDGIEDKLRKWILTSKLLKTEPFRMCAIALELGWEVVALTAARRTLHVPLEKLPFVDELKNISGSEFYRFLDYRFRCDKSAGSSSGEFMTPAKSMRWSEPNTTPSGKAPEPFDSSANGNVIFRSSDSVDFFVIEGLIRLVSPYFDEMFSSQKHDEINGRPIIRISEDSRVLHGLLCMIYPYGDEPVTGDYYLCKQVLRAARKYKISIVEKKLRKLATVLVDKEPLRMYAIATSLGWDEVAKMAALNTLSQPFQDMKFVEEMDEITGADLFTLMRYRFTCAEEACKVAKDSSVHLKYGFGVLAQSLVDNRYNSGCVYCGYRQSGCYYRGDSYCQKCGNYGHVQKPSRTSPTLNTSGEVNSLLRICPRGGTYKFIYALEFARLAELPSDTTQHYLEFSVAKTIVEYRDGLVTAIEDAVSKVLPLLFYS